MVLHVHGAGWVFGNSHTHDRLIRELADGTGAAVVFPNYSLSPEARYPTAIEESYVVLRWVAEHDLDGSRIAVSGDSVGGKMSAALTLMAKERSKAEFAAQALFYPVPDAAFDTGSYHQFAEGYFLRRDAMQWFWGPVHDRRGGGQRGHRVAAASHRRAARRATARARDHRRGGRAARRGRGLCEQAGEVGVPVVTARYEGIIHDFVMLSALRDTNAAEAAITQAIGYLRQALGTTSA